MGSRKQGLDGASQALGTGRRGREASWRGPAREISAGVAPRAVSMTSWKGARSALDFR